MAWKNWKGPQLEELIKKAATKAVQDTCYVILEASKQEVPHDEGTLMRSGVVLMEPSGLPIGVVSFGGGKGTGHPIVPYAIRWHENSANFQKGRKSRYLADPVNRLGQPTLRASLEQELRGVLR